MVVESIAVLVASLKAVVRHRALTIFVIFVLNSVPCLAVNAEFSGEVVGIADGDTIKVMHDGRPEKIRLFGIDCPEKGQAFGNKAKQFSSELAFGKTVTVQEHGLDKYGRTIGVVILPDGRNLNRELVAAGLAWWYESIPRMHAWGSLRKRLGQRSVACGPIPNRFRLGPGGSSGNDVPSDTDGVPPGHHRVGRRTLSA